MARMRKLVFGLAAAAFAMTASAGEPWLAQGNVQVRHDLELLVDEGVINLPISAWPIPVSDLAAALSRVGKQPVESSTAAGRAVAPVSLSPAQAAAVQRLRRYAREGQPQIGSELRITNRPVDLRTFADDPREQAEVSAWVSGFMGDRWGGRLQVRGVSDPDDDQPLRLDGSYLAGKFGNWIVTAGAMDRWWGSGWDGSLILSNNARPIPSISLDRAVSDPFETRWLSWLGPWRMTTFMGYMDGDRQDYDHPLLFGLRLSARPLKGLEISLERTAQWCGQGRSCNWDDFWNLWWGNDNAGENVDPEDEPGNQLAGWDIRWASPFGGWPYAVYFQHTGETIDNKIPRPYRSLELAGLEFWGESDDAASWRVSLEWSLTRCGGTEDGDKLWDCAYNNNVFNVEGYRYLGRPIGHSMDGDGEMYSVRYIKVEEDGATWGALARFTGVNQGGEVPDTRHSVAPGPEDWISVDVSYRRPAPWGWWELAIGADYREREWDNTDALLPRVSLNWHHESR
jgi:hypothetical protein